MRSIIFFGCAAAILVGGVLSVGSAVYAAPVSQESTPESQVYAVIVVERAVVFPSPDRTADPLTYLFERERVPIQGQSADGAWLLVSLDGAQGWILRAQVDIEGDLALVPVVGPTPAPTLTFTPFQVGPASLTLTPTPKALAATVDPAEGGAGEDEMPILIGEPPPIGITVPEDWESVHLIVPYRTFVDEAIREIPLSIYFGALSEEATGFVYLYWGFPNTKDLITRENNLWADGVQLLRFSLIGADCNLGVYDQEVFPIGEGEGVGAYYQAADCPDENDTAGWFVVTRAEEGIFAVFVAVEPPAAMLDYRDMLRDILNTIELTSPRSE